MGDRTANFIKPEDCFFIDRLFIKRFVFRRPIYCDYVPIVLDD